VVSEPWLTCLELAWEAYQADTVPVGAVVVGPDGAVVSRGRNRIHEHDAPPGQLANTYLAHAEINALAQLPAAPYPDHALYTTLEPCPLCIGAAVMAMVGKVRFAANDYFSGSSASVPHKYLGDRVTVEGPLQSPVGLLAAAIHLDYYFRQRPDGRLIQVHRDRAHPALAVAERARDEQWYRKSLTDVLGMLVAET
jgi:tRNA(adenine34) deaminase